MNLWKLYARVIRIIKVAVVSSLYVLAVQATELPARGPISFAAYDQDGSGSISEAEFSAVRAERMASKAAAGMPMRGAANAPSFSTFDLNTDGQLSPDELFVGQQKMQEQRRGMGMGAGQGPGMGRGMGRGRNMPTFGDFDLNSDGMIAEEEFLKAQGQRINERYQAGYPMRNIGNIPVFADIDSNADGAIMPDEFSAHQVQHRQRMMQQ